MYMCSARLFVCCCLATKVFIVGNRMGVAGYKIGQLIKEANNKQSLIDVQVSLSTETDRQTDRPNYSNSRCACTLRVKYILQCHLTESATGEPLIS